MDVINDIGLDTASKFILPMVMKKDATYKDVPKTFARTHISIFDKPEFDDHIILVSSSPKDLPKCRRDLSLRGIYEEKDKAHLHIFEIPTEYEDDLYKIVGGDYPQLSEEYKRRLLSFWQEDNNSPLYGVLYHVLKLALSHNTIMQNLYEVQYAKGYHNKPTIRELIYGIRGE